MSGWIKFWKDMPADPRVLAAASMLAKRMPIASLSVSEQIALWRNAVTGALATLWGYADEHIRDDDTLPLTSQTLDAVVGIGGFFELMPREWIDELDDGSLILPGYCEKNSLIAKRKRTIKSNARVTQWRRSKKRDGNGVTGRHVTHGNTAGDSDQDKTKTETREERKNARENDPEHRIRFETLKAAYPRGTYRQADWLVAEREIEQRLDDGHAWLEFTTGVERYTRQCEARQGIGTQFVLSPSKFFAGGRMPPFLDPFPLPATKADSRLAGNMSAAEEFMRRTETG